jgi:UV DNA damage repair endonuclease
VRRLPSYLDGDQAERRASNCDCWVLTHHHLVNETLPDHACEATMRATVAGWARISLARQLYQWVHISNSQPPPDVQEFVRVIGTGIAMLG